jgi:hypothetical protein
MSLVLILFPNYTDLISAINTSAFLPTHSVLLEWLYDTCILGRDYNGWVFSKYNVAFLTAGHTSAIYIFMYTILWTQFMWSILGHHIVWYVVINVWMNILSHRLCEDAGGNFSHTCTPTYQSTWCIKPKNNNLKLFKFSTVLRSTKVKGWCGKVHNLFTDCYVAVMLQFHKADDII